MDYSPLLLTFSSLLQIAQISLTECQPPQPNQYLILIRTATEQAQTQVRRTLASTPINSLVCNYQGEIVTRIGGFNSLEDTRKWANYFNETVKLSAYIVVPSGVPTQPDYPLFQPQVVASRYVVLIDYFNRPEVAKEVRGLLARDLGLAVYLSRPYLLAIQTNNEREAQFILNRLTQEGFWAIAVDGATVIMLTPKVNY
jgi:hypothetical protein